MAIDALERLRGMGMAKPRRRPRYEEDKLQIACRYWFDTQFPRLSLLLHHSPNEGLLMRHDRDGAKRKAMGMRAGFPDFIFLKPNKFYSYLAIELKSAKGRQTAHQKAYQEAVEGSGGRYVIVRKVEQFVSEIKEYLKDI